MHIQAFIPSDKTNWKVLQSQMYQFCFILCICRHKHLDWLKTALLLWVPKQKEQSSLVMVQYPECCSKHRVHTQALLGNCWVKEKCMFLTQSINEVRWPKKKKKQTKFHFWMTTGSSKTWWPHNLSHTSVALWELPKWPKEPPLYFQQSQFIEFLKKENCTTTYKQPRSQHCCQKQQTPFSVYGKLIRLKVSSVAGCIMGRENYFSFWICFLNCITAQTENKGWKIPAHIRFR